MGSEPTDIKSIFVEALEMAADERPNFLDRVCGNNDSLRRKVEEFLRLHEDVGDFLESPPLIDQPPLPKRPEEKLGTTIDKYKLLEKIGEGGMAVVYMAEQTEPIRRKVALKIIKLGMDTKSVIARFEAERQALAMMEHSNIAKVFDAGATDTGRPYFVMELVTGVSITEYCDNNNLSTKQRLELFIQVCNAVQHAHQKGIIHRDIKPTNVMVTLRDGQPIPKVIDFGIAKAINQKLTEKTLFTRYAHIIGTPAYMSPEQAELSELDIDTRTDIYSLGVLLYELLTGTTPFGEEELRKAGYMEMQRIIREQEPTKPSTKLSTLGQTLTDIAKHRSATPDILRKAVRGDLDWIVMKSLEKDRSRRYETANMLALDIRHHLENEPVTAGAPGTTYRLQKFLRRHRSQTIAALTLFVIFGAVIIILSMWRRDRLQLDEAEGFRHRGILSQAREQYAKAEREAALETLKPILNSKDVGPEAQLLYAGILVDDRRYDDAIESLENLLNERPEIAGAAYSLLARLLWESQSLDAEKRAEIEEYRQRAEELLPETAEAHYLRAMTALTIKDKLELLDEALRIDRGHYESCRLRALIYYASRRYDKMERDAWAMVLLQPQNPLGYTLHATALRELGQLKDALAEYDAAIERSAREGTSGVELHIQRCEMLMRMNEYEQVVKAAKECLERWPDRAEFHFHMVGVLTALGEFQQATAQYHRMVESIPQSRARFRDWCTKYVFDTLGEQRPWHPPDSKPRGTAFLFMLDAEETYHRLSAKARRLMPYGFGPKWSSDGTKLTFGLGVHGYSGIAVFDLASQETDLLIVPGRSAQWSPDGQWIAFVRDCQVLRLSELTAVESGNQTRSAPTEVWIMKADGTDPRRLVNGGMPSWSQDSRRVHYLSHIDKTKYSISIDDPDATPTPIATFSGYGNSMSPDHRHVATVTDHRFLTITDLDSQTVVADWVGPPRIFAGGWSRNGRELPLCGYFTVAKDQTGLWIYDLDRKEATKVLDGQITGASWSPDGRQLAFALERPLAEIWVADLDPNLSTTESLAPSQTLEQHYQQMIDRYTRMIEADPEDAEGYLHRSEYHHFRGDEDSYQADMDAYGALCNPPGPWRGNAINLGPIVNSLYSDVAPSLSADGLSLFFGSWRGVNVDCDLYVTTRTTTNDPWGEPVSLGPTVNSPARDECPSISSDGRSLYFMSARAGGLGSRDLWVTTRETKDSSSWSIPANLGPPVNSPASEGGGSLTDDGLTLYFFSTRPGGRGNWDIWMTTRATKDTPWRDPVNLGPTVNSPDVDAAPVISADGRMLLFMSSRPGGYGSWDAWVTRRARVDDQWGPPVNLGPRINTSGLDGHAILSADGSTLYFMSDRSGGFGYHDLWQVSIPPVRESLQQKDHVDLIQKLIDSHNRKEVLPVLTENR